MMPCPLRRPAGAGPPAAAAASRRLVLGSVQRRPPPGVGPARAAAGFSAKAAEQRRKARQRQQQKQRQQRRRPGDGSSEEDEGEGGGGGELSELSEARHVITVPDFSPDLCRQLRQVFDDRFGDPRHTSEEMFLWNWFHIPEQYTLHRTQAAAYFPPELHERLVDALLDYGERQLGCRAISPIWLSYYTDGCVQELHCDSFHGPFAFVLSLTHWDGRAFTGGETAILQPRVLGDFWGSFTPGKGLELRDLVMLVPPRFSQLTVFDPRFPHGVREVHGTRHPQQGRIVLHGWFTEPSPFFDGPLAADDALAPLDAALAPMLDQLRALPRVLGTTSVRLTVSGATGAVQGPVEFLADTLVAPPAAAADAGLGGGLLDSSVVRGAVQHTITDHLLSAHFPPCPEGDTSITLPLVFE